MTRQQQEEMFEALLKAAAMEMSLKELLSYPPEEVIRQTVVTESCDQKVRKRMRHFYYRDRIRSAGQHLKRAAAVILIVVSITFGGLYLHSPEVRAAVRYAIVKVFDRFMNIKVQHIDDDSGEEKQYEPGYIPDGYKLKSDMQNELMRQIEYVNNAGSDIGIEYYKRGNLSMNVDNEGFDITECRINGYEGLMFISRDGKKNNRVLWSTGKATFTIVAALGEEELLKIAENIK